MSPIFGSYRVKIRVLIRLFLSHRPNHNSISGCCLQSEREISFFQSSHEHSSRLESIQSHQKVFFLPLVFNYALREQSPLLLFTSPLYQLWVNWRTLIEKKKKRIFQYLIESICCFLSLSRQWQTCYGLLNWRLGITFEKHYISSRMTYCPNPITFDRSIDRFEPRSWANTMSFEWNIWLH